VADNLMPSPLTQEHIESVVNGLPPQGRIMLRLLLLQYLDLTQEDIEYIAMDRPDPRMLAGAPTKVITHVTQDNLKSITDRVEQYRHRLRQRRERISLQTECLTRQIAVTEAYCKAAERLLVSRFGFEPAKVEQLKTTAPTTVLRPAVRELDRKWEQDEIGEEDYRKERLTVEYQLLLRRLDRDRRRLNNVRREHDLTSHAPLQDHELAHVWGLPAGTLAARKVKYLHLYLQGLQVKLRETSRSEAVVPPVDLWKETFQVMATRRVERSVATYDGLERTETQLMDKITALTYGTMPEELESRFWQSMTQETKHAAEYGSLIPSLFALQRYSALLAEIESEPDDVVQDLLIRVSPKAKAVVALPEAEQRPAQLGDMAEHVLRSFTGEDHTDTRGKR
jgi:hypothetical protein